MPRARRLDTSPAVSCTNVLVRSCCQRAPMRSTAAELNTANAANAPTFMRSALAPSPGKANKTPKRNSDTTSPSTTRSTTTVASTSLMRTGVPVSAVARFTR